MKKIRPCLFLFIALFFFGSSFSQAKVDSLNKMTEQLKLLLKYSYNDKYLISYDSMNQIAKPFFSNTQLYGSITVKNKEGDSLNYVVMKYSDREKINSDILKFFTYSNSSFPSPFCGYFFYKNYLFVLPGLTSWNNYSDGRKYMTLLMCEAVEHLAQTQK